MHHSLKQHPDSRCTAVTGIDVSVMRLAPSVLLLHYQVSGAINDLRLGASAPPVRTDDLWRHTCFEAFLRPYCDDRYFELNLAPSTQWATYAFDAYRSGMRDARDINAPGIQTSRRGDHAFDLRVAIDLQALDADDAPWRLGLSAVIEDTHGATSYWAAAHPAGKPDFHHADSFAIVLPPPEHP